MSQITDARGSRTGKRINLLSQGQFLNIAWKAAHWYRDYRLLEISYDSSTLYFRVRSHSRPNMFHEVRILLSSIAEQMYYNRVAETVYNQDPKKRNFSSYADKAFLKSTLPIKPKELGKALQESPLKVYCGCEMFLYWGFQYIAWKKGFGLVPMHRVPHVKNPGQQGYVCNHLFFILAYVLPRLYPTVERLLIRKGLLNYKKEPAKEGENTKEK